jgi:CheY-like chemotaxis protein
MTTVLIVDDRAVNRQFMSSLLRHFDYDVLESVNGVEALFTVQTERPDVVITDILMPRMDGLQLVQQIRNDEALRSTKVIFYSATYRLQDARQMAASLGVHHLISKPAEPAVILDTIALALGERLDGGAARRKAAATTAAAAAAAAASRPAYGLTKQFIQTVDNLEATSIRLAAIIELCLDLTAERDPERIIDLFCGAARDLLGASHAAVAITDGRGGPVSRFTTRGYGPAEESLLRGAAERRDLLPNPPSGQNRMRHPRPGVTAAELGFPATLTLPTTLLSVSLALGERDLGWFYVSGKQAEKTFDDEDVRIAHTLGALAALIYENAIQFQACRGETASIRLEADARGRSHK